MRQDRSGRKKIIAGILRAAVDIAAFGGGLYLAENHGLSDVHKWKQY